MTVYTPVIETVEDGIRLDVTPTITKDNFIILDLKPQLDKLISMESISTPSGTIEKPITSVREAEMKVVLRDGQTILIGGLTQKKRQKSESRLPYVHKIPLIGKLFRKKKVDVDNIQLNIFITANIMRYRGDDIGTTGVTPEQVPQESVK